MNHHDPVKLVSEPDFSQAASYYHSDTPNGVRVSQNGRFIALYNAGHIHMFDMKHPQLSWQPKSRGALDAEIVVPTDNGNYWVSINNHISLMTGAEGHSLLFHTSSFFSNAIWGNDGWLLMHGRQRLRYTDMQSMSTMQTQFGRVILHAWKHGEHIRLLSVSTHKKWLYLHEWDGSDQRPRLINKVRGDVPLGVDGIDADYMFMQCIHAWPDDNGGVIVKLVPGRVNVSASGAIEFLPAPCDWHPIINGSSPLERETLACASACALSEGLDPRSGFGSTPYLITTLQTEDDLHFISTRWHKSMALSDCRQLDMDLVGVRIEADNDIGRLVLSACRETIPCHHAFITMIINEVDKCRHWKQAPAYLRPLKSAIRQLFRSMLETMIASDAEAGESSDDTSPARSLYEALLNIAPIPGVIEDFYDGISNGAWPEKSRNQMLHLTRTIIPTLPGRILRRLPATLQAEAIPLSQTLDAMPGQFSDRDIAFFIRKAKPELFSVQRLLELLGQCDISSTLLHALADKTDDMIALLPDLSPEQQLQARNSIVDLLQEPPESLQLHIICRVYYHLGGDSRLPADAMIRLLKRDSWQPLQLAEYLAGRAAEPAEREHKIAAGLLTVASEAQLVPLFILIMANLNAAGNESELREALQFNNVETDSSSPGALVEALWKAPGKLMPQYRKPYAIALLAAIRRCLPASRAIARAPAFGQPLVTAEAALLNKVGRTPKRAMDEIVACAGEA